MASVSIEKRKSKAGRITYRAKVRLTLKGEIKEDKNQTFSDKKLAVLWSEKMRLFLDDKYSKIKAGEYREEDDLQETTIGELIKKYLSDYTTQVEVDKDIRALRLKEEESINLINASNVIEEEKSKQLNLLKIKYEKKYKSISGAKTIGRTKNYVLKALLKYKIASILASNLRAKDLVEHCKYRLEESSNPKPQTVYHDVTYLRSVMKDAKALYNINANLTYHDEAISILKRHNFIGRSGNRNDKSPTEDQLSLMKEGLRKRQNHPSASTPYLDILDISLLTAMRISEITSIRWEDFNYEKKTLRIRNRKSPSNKMGNDSIIPLIGDAPEILKRQPRSKDVIKSDLIFPHESKTVTAGWQKVRKSLNIVDVRYHDIRRYAATNLILAGLPINLVSIITGHRNINILHNIYQKFNMENFDINDFTPIMTKKQG
ncbi:site-specific integrase [Colwellia sp. E2M01]|uniref:tyrosine-type recombinase/integrase n=1 Tax=Colwellia sp. E2M01 TaxID=2841561 RepID=UPI001C09835B|nr:site-specific integrase [Colwellia sp. E2M01]MBU2871423.1 site-specific integrase [Colwellia sp. E2M01]